MPDPQIFDHPFNDAVRAWASVAGAVAWPGAVIGAVYALRVPIGNLIDRLRKGPYGTEFASPQVSPTLAPQLPIGIGALEGVRTADVKFWEKTIDDHPEVKNAASAEAKINALRTIAARMVVVAMFERIDSIIFGTQINLIEQLSNRAGEPVEALDKEFWVRAQAQFPDLYARWSFTNFLAYLYNWKLIEETGGIVRVTERGRDYANWRRSVGLAQKNG